MTRQPFLPLSVLKLPFIYLNGRLLSITLAVVVTVAGSSISHISHAEPTVTVTTPQLAADVNGNPTAPEQNPATLNQNSLAAQLQPTNEALSQANQELLSRNARLQREVNDLQTQVNVLIYESQGQMFLYGALTVIISMLLGILVSWFIFTRRQRW